MTASKVRGDDGKYFCAERPRSHWPKEKPEFVWIGKQCLGGNRYIELLKSGYRVEKVSMDIVYMCLDRR